MSRGFSSYFKEPLSCRTVRYSLRVPDKTVAIKKVMLLGDLHISSIVSPRQRDMIRDKIHAERPDVILLQGDLIDRPEMLRNPELRDQLERTLLLCTKYAPTVGVVGNHDQLRQGSRWKKETLEEFRRRYDPEVLPTLRTIFETTGANLLLDDWLELGGIEFFGFYQDPDAAFPEHSLTFMKEKLSHLGKEGLLKGKRQKTLKWFLAHAPLDDLVSLPELSAFDVFSFGHTHGGCVPVGLDRIFDSLGANGGLVAPHFRLLPHDWMRGKKVLDDGKTVFLNSGMVATQFSAPRPFWYLNFLKQAEITIIEIEG